MDEIDLTHPKSAELEEGRRFDKDNLAWRDGSLLMVRKDAILPDRCLKCNEPALGYQFRRSLTWASPYYFVLLLCGLLPFALVYLLLCHRGRVTVGICPRQSAKANKGHSFRLADLTRGSWLDRRRGSGSRTLCADCSLCRRNPDRRGLGRRRGRFAGAGGPANRQTFHLAEKRLPHVSRDISRFKRIDGRSDRVCRKAKAKESARRARARCSG